MALNQFLEVEINMLNPSFIFMIAGGLLAILLPVEYWNTYKTDKSERNVRKITIQKRILGIFIIIVAILIHFNLK